MEELRDTQWHSEPLSNETINMTYSSQRYQGTECDGYADNFSLRVAVYTVVTPDHMDCPAATYPGNCTSGYMLNPTLPSPSPQLTVAQINSLLKAHNDMRRDVYPAARTMPMLTWDQTLANFAYSYIQTCPGVKHSSQTARVNPDAYNYGYLGENLAAGTDTTKYGINGGANAVAMWNGQAKGYTYVGPPTCNITYPHVCGTCNISDCGHYTQVVWGFSTSVGCAYAYCPTTTYINYWLCAYGPGGNYMGQDPYDASTPMDQCQMNGVPLSSFAEESLRSQRRDGDNLTAAQYAEAVQQLAMLSRSVVRGHDHAPAEVALVLFPAWTTAVALWACIAAFVIALLTVRLAIFRKPQTSYEQVVCSEL
jgi:pathogenesis-related protein 1